MFVEFGLLDEVFRPDVGGQNEHVRFRNKCRTKAGTMGDHEDDELKLH